MRFLNVVIGLLIAIALSALLGLGVKAFHPGPIMPNYPGMTASQPMCEDKDINCLEKKQEWNNRYEKVMEERLSLQKEYEEKMGKYSRDVFIIYNVAGVMFFIGGFLITKLLAIRTAFAVGAGMVISGFYAIIIGYTVGWNSTDDRLKFFVGLVLFAILVGFSLIIGKQRMSQASVENFQVNNHS